MKIPMISLKREQIQGNTKYKKTDKMGKTVFKNTKEKPLQLN